MFLQPRTYESKNVCCLGVIIFYIRLYPGFEAPDGDCEEIDSGRPTSRQSRHSSDLGLGRKGGFTLDHFTGDSLLHFSYSASGRVGLGLTPDSQLGNESCIITKTLVTARYLVIVKWCVGV